MGSGDLKTAREWRKQQNNHAPSEINWNGGESLPGTNWNGGELVQSLLGTVSFCLLFS